MVFVGAAAGSRCALASSIRLSQHPDQHRPEHSVLLAVDQDFDGPAMSSTIEQRRGNDVTRSNEVIVGERTSIPDHHR
jgi:hypothetical protein